MAFAPLLPAQSAASKKVVKGPRALGLVELLPNGKARLIPITILIDGEFYDASAYKAAPVPMALESGTVYEGIRTGVSEGLFTVTGALRGNNTWVGTGTWQTMSAIAAAKEAAAKKKAVMSAPAPAPPEGPPTLRRTPPKPKSQDAASGEPTASGPTTSGPAGSGPASPSPPPAAPPTSAPATPAPATGTAAANAPPPEAKEDSDRPTLKRPAPATETPASAAATPAAQPEADPDRPQLKRGAPTPEELKKRAAASAAASTTAAVKDSRKPGAPASIPPAAVPTPAQLVAAVSDAAGPDPRPYTYGLKPEEEQKLRKKVLALAADEVRAWAAESGGSQPAPRPGSKARPPQPVFENVQLHAFDLSNSNEPIVVLSANARMPAKPNAPADLQYIITLVARDDMYGELHKVFASVTDTNHFDVLSRLELIDAVDADGDGRGELLFRQMSDSGNAFVLYRVIGDRLWPLFQGTPGQ